jgi:hypothetical protein
MTQATSPLHGCSPPPHRQRNPQLVAASRVATSKISHGPSQALDAPKSRILISKGNWTSGDVRGHAADVWGSRGREFKSHQPDWANGLAATSSQPSAAQPSAWCARRATHSLQWGTAARLGVTSLSLPRRARQYRARRAGPYAVRIEDSASLRSFSSTFHASMWDGLSLSSGLAPILLPTMCVRAIVLYRFFRSDASSAALLDRFVPKHGR